MDDWVDQSGQPAQPVTRGVGDAEVCATTPTSTLAPYDSQYEGYMGNYGNTMDRWYQRGAMVVWPRRLDFAVRAEASPSWALDTLAARLRDGEVARARELFDSAANFWMNVVRARVSMHHPASPQAHQPDLGQALAVAHGLDDATRAAILLRPFSLELLSPADVPALMGAADRYGEGWTSRVLDEWDAGRARSYPAVDHRRAWIASLPEFCDALTQSGGGIVAQLVLKSSSRWLLRRCGRPSHRLSHRAGRGTSTR